MSCRATRRTCPRCGSVLLTDGRWLWCSLITGGRAGCGYGAAGTVPVPPGESPDEPPERPVMEDGLGVVDDDPGDDWYRG